MDAYQFDGFARALTANPSRRAVVRAPAGLAVAGALGAAGRADADAKACGSCRMKKHGRCKKHRPDDTPCERDGRCWSGICNPPPM